MSEAVSAMNGAMFEGAVLVKDAGLRGMITLRGDLDDAGLKAAVKSVTGLAVPGVREIKHGKKGSVAWMSPDELLLIVAYQDADAVAGKLSSALQGKHALVANVSDARAVFSIDGKGCREVIAKGAPVDMSPAAMPVGQIKRTRLGQVAVAFWMADTESIELVCFRSVAPYVFEWLSVAGQPNSLPGMLTPP